MSPPETPPPYARFDWGNFELAALCEVFGRTKRRKALASTRSAQGFSAGATKTSASVGRTRFVGLRSKPTLPHAGGFMMTSIKEPI